MKRTDFIKIMSLAGTGLSLQSLKKQSQSVPRPNVIILLTDDQGYGDISAHGNPVIRTPNMDRLHAESVRCTNFHVDPTCAPTRGALMTGKYAHHVRVWHTIASGNSLRKTEVTMADVFKNSNYSTAIFGKWHLGANYPYRPMDRGFEEWLGSGAGGPGTSDDYFTNDRVNDHYWYNGVREYRPGYNPDVFYDAAIEYIKKKANSNKPFFIYVPTYAPHGPCSIPDKMRARAYIEKGLNKSIAYHYAMIEYIDDNIGRILNTLEKTGKANDTLIIFMSDNGATKGRSVFNAGMRGGKGSEYDGGHRVPCFFRWPNGKLAAGKDIKELNAHIDVLPTLIDLCSLKPPRKVDFDGRSFKDQLFDPIRKLPIRVVCVEKQRTIEVKKWNASSAMMGSWRLVNNKELYNIATDPGQKINIINKYPEVVKKLRKGFDKYWQTVTPGDREKSRAIIGTKMDPETFLTGEAWLKNPVWNHNTASKGKKGDGLWHIHVSETGSYQIEARRWPREAAAPFSGSPKLNKKIDAWINDIPVDGLLYKNPKFKSLSVNSVQLSINGKVMETRSVSPDKEAIVFKIQLKAGDATLMLQMLDKKSKVVAPIYYVYITRET